MMSTTLLESMRKAEEALEGEIPKPSSEETSLAAGAFEPTNRPLSGSPAQIEWATAIRARVSDEFDRVASSFRGIADRQTLSKKNETEAILAIVEAKRVEVLSHDVAGYFIHDWNEINDQVRQMIFKDSGFQAIRVARATGKSER